MLSTKLAQLTLLIGLTGALGACGGAHYYGYGPPPAPRVVGAVGYAPGPGYVWIDGFYRPGPSGTYGPAAVGPAHRIAAVTGFPDALTIVVTVLTGGKVTGAVIRREDRAE